MSHIVFSFRIQRPFSVISIYSHACFYTTNNLPEAVRYSFPRNNVLFENKIQYRV